MTDGDVCAMYVQLLQPRRATPVEQVQVLCADSVGLKPSGQLQVHLQVLTMSGVHCCKTSLLPARDSLKTISRSKRWVSCGKYMHGAHGCNNLSHSCSHRGADKRLTALRDSSLRPLELPGRSFIVVGACAA